MRRAVVCIVIFFTTIIAVCAVNSLRTADNIHRTFLMKSTPYYLSSACRRLNRTTVPFSVSSFVTDRQRQQSHFVIQPDNFNIRRSSLRLYASTKDNSKDSTSADVAFSLQRLMEEIVDEIEDETPRETVIVKSTIKTIPIDLDLVKKQTKLLQKILDVEDYKIDILFCSESKIRRLNADWRGKSKSTDVLSFPSNDFTSPEVFKEDQKDVRKAMKYLGNIVIAPRYVQRQCQRDQEDYYEDEDEDAGCSLAMSTLYTLEERIPLLLIHSVLHLLGYDHETDKDFDAMTTKEDEVISALNKQK